MNTPFLGGTYRSRSLSLAAQRCMNLYLEMVETKEGKEAGGFYGCPGLDLLATIGPGPIRAMIAAPANPTQLYIVSGPEVHALNTSFVDLKNYGSLATTTSPVQVISSPTQLLFVDGFGGYVIDHIAQTLQQVLPGAIGVKPVSCAYQDGFAVVNTSNALSQAWYQSDLNEFRNWQALNFSSADGEPDPVSTLFDIHREVWVFGTQSVEIWFNAGLPGFAFARNNNVFIENGCAAPNSVARVGQGVMWLGQDTQGAGIVWRADGYVPQRVSTHAVETAIRSYLVAQGQIADAFAYCYQDEGHVFYVLTFPSSSATWVYDATENMWHERGFLSLGGFTRHLSNCYAFFNGQHIVGDYRNGNLYHMNLESYTDNGSPRKWIRAWRGLGAGQNNRKPMTFNGLAIDCETGITVPPGLNPQIVLRYSDDGGRNWSSEIQAPLGQTGDTTARAEWSRLGSTSLSGGLDRVFEISGTDPVRPVLVGAHMDAEPA